MMTWQLDCQEYCHRHDDQAPGNYSVWKLCDTWHLWHVWEDRGGGTVTVHYADIIHQTYCYNLNDWLDMWTSAWGLPGHFFMWHHGDIQRTREHPRHLGIHLIYVLNVAKIIASIFIFFEFKNNIHHVSWALELIGRLHFRTNAVCAAIIFGGSFQWVNHMKGFQNSFVHMDIMPLSRVLTQN